MQHDPAYDDVVGEVRGTISTTSGNQSPVGSSDSFVRKYDGATGVEVR